MIDMHQSSVDVKLETLLVFDDFADTVVGLTENAVDIKVVSRGEGLQCGPIRSVCRKEGGSTCRSLEPSAYLDDVALIDRNVAAQSSVGGVDMLIVL